MANEVLKLAYEAALVALQQQDTSLGSIRNRATGLLAAAAVGTSIATGVGLYKVEPGATTLPGWAGWTLLLLTVAVGGSVMYTLLPTPHWNYGADPEGLLASASMDIDDVYRGATEAMVIATAANLAQINRRVTAYRIGTGTLILQIVVLILGVLLI